MKKILALLLAISLVLGLAACGKTEQTLIPGTQIALSDENITVDGKGIGKEGAVYAAHDIIYYEDGHDFTYGEGEKDDAHTKEEAAAHTVVHITKPGTYVISGTISAGQIAVDLGESAQDDPNAVVTLVLNGADITCTVAPAIIFYQVYECGDAENPVMTVDTTAAGANILLAEGTQNTVNGAYVARIYKSVTLSEDGTEIVDSKKLHKYDGAIYSKMSMNIDGTGVLNVNAENEGIDSEMHLTVNGGTLNIFSGDDGINTNEDNISVTTINGGTVNICVTGNYAGEGDGIDSNGWLVINDGTVITAACGQSQDSGIDSDCGIYLNGGLVISTGNMLDAIQGEQTYAVFTFREKQTAGQTYSLKNADGATAVEITPANDFTVLVMSAPELIAGEYTMWQGDIQLSGMSAGMVGGFDMGGNQGERPELPEGVTPPEGMKFPENGQPPEMEQNFGHSDSKEPPKKPEGEQPRENQMPQPDEEYPLPGGYNGEMQGKVDQVFSLKQGSNSFTIV